MKNIVQTIGSKVLGGSQPFTLVRTLTLKNGKRVTEHITGTGNIQPAGTQQLTQLAEKDRINRVCSLKTTTPLQLGEERAAQRLGKDRIVIGEDVYNVVSLSDWSRFGFQSALIHWIGKVDKGGGEDD